MSDSGTPQNLPIRVFGGPTVLIDAGGLRILTDPTFDAPGEYPLGPGLVAVKTAPASITATELGPVDVVLLSHDQHPDNLDHSGRALLADVPTVLTTSSGAARLGGTTRGLTPWQRVELPRPDGGTLTVTATPAQHGPEGAEAFTGEVIGFVLTAPDLPTVYVSGDNASLEVVQQVADRFGPVDTAILFAGAARNPVLFDGALLTIDSAQAAEATTILGARRVIPAHYDSWTHFTEGRQEILDAFTNAGLAKHLEIN